MERPARPSEGLEGKVLGGRYRLERRIGSGGFGVVYLGEDTRIRRRVAIKVLSSVLAGRPEALERFQREASAAGRIGHEGIVSVTDFDLDDDGTPFLVMEHVEGGSLSRLLAAEAPLDPVRALCIGARMAQAFAAAHAEGIVHRDLKPANVLLTSVGGVEDFIKIVDFGVSKFLRRDDRGETLTDDGQVVGTPRYMSPEQGMGCRDVDSRSDVYSLGVILFEMLTGRPPFAGKTVYEVVHRKLTQEPAPPSALSPAPIPEALDRIVLRALAREPDRRVSSMNALDAALREVLAELDPEAADRVAPARAPSPPGPATDSPSALTEYLAEKAPLTPAPLSSLPSPSPLPPPAAQTPAPPPRRRAPLLAAGALLVTGAIGLVFLSSGGQAGAAPEAREDANEERSSSLVEPAPKAPGSVPPTVELALALDPPDARVELDGVVVRDHPLVLPRSPQTHELVVTAPGHRPEQRTIRALTSGEIRIDLEPAPATERPRHEKPPHQARLPDSPL